MSRQRGSLVREDSAQGLRGTVGDEVGSWGKKCQRQPEKEGVPWGQLRDRPVGAQPGAGSRRSERHQQEKKWCREVWRGLPQGRKDLKKGLEATV